MTQPKNNITELRDILFDTLRGLKNKENPIDINHAQAVSEVAQTIINSAKLEIDYCRVTGETSATGFIPAEAGGNRPMLPPAQGQETEQPDRPQQVMGGNSYIHLTKR